MRSFLVAALAGSTLAFPAIPNILEDRDDIVARHGKPGCRVSKQCDAPHEVSDADIDYNPKSLTAQQKKAEALTNCGAFNGPCKSFDAKAQYVSISGVHRYIKPKAGQIRGPCPGLNAAANHAYLPRDGTATILETTSGLSDLYGMSFGVGAFLAAYAIALDGDIVSAVWSIGGPPPKGLLPLGPARGISYSHNKYEGDASIGRCDAYLNNGDAHSLSLQKFKYAYESGMDNDRYTLPKFFRAFTKNSERSIATNPYYFAPLFSTTIVSPAAYNFVINFMSNRTAEEHSGYLDGEQFKTFFGVTGNYPNFKWLPGQEKIPPNWYRRPKSDSYKVPGVVADVAQEFLAYPKSFRFGGNSNGVNTYTGIDLSDFTGGSITNAAQLLKGDNLACFFFQNAQQGIIDLFKGNAQATKQRLKFLQPFIDATPLTCSAAPKLDTTQYNNYPGSGYNPTGPGSTC